jgi:hypothetical protein
LVGYLVVGSLSSLFSSCLEFRLRDGGRVGSQRTVLNQWISELQLRFSFSSSICFLFRLPRCYADLKRKSIWKTPRPCLDHSGLNHTPRLQSWLMRLSLYLLLQALPLITSTHPPSFHLPPMHLLNLPQHPKIIDHKKHPRNHHNSPAHNRRHPRRDTPHAALLTIHIRKCRYEPSKRVQTSRHKDLIQQPHEVRAPAPPEPDHPGCTDTTAHSRNYQELHVLDTVQDLGSRVRGVQLVGCAERGECSREDDEAG